MPELANMSQSTSREGWPTPGDPAAFFAGAVAHDDPGAAHDETSGACCSACAVGNPCAGGACATTAPANVPERVSLPAGFTSAGFHGSPEDMRGAALDGWRAESGPSISTTEAELEIIRGSLPAVTSGTSLGELRRNAPPPTGVYQPPTPATPAPPPVPDDPTLRVNATDARNWVDAGLGVLRSRFAAADAAAEREFLERAAATQLADNQNRREYELRLAEIRARYQSATNPVTTPAESSSSMAGPALAVLGVAFLGFVAFSGKKGR